MPKGLWVIACFSPQRTTTRRCGTSPSQPSRLWRTASRSSLCPPPMGIIVCQCQYCPQAPPMWWWWPRTCQTAPGNTFIMFTLCLLLRLWTLPSAASPPQGQGGGGVQLSSIPHHHQVLQRRCCTDIQDQVFLSGMLKGLPTSCPTGSLKYLLKLVTF